MKRIIVLALCYSSVGFAAPENLYRLCAAPSIIAAAAFSAADDNAYLNPKESVDELNVLIPTNLSTVLVSTDAATQGKDKLKVINEVYIVSQQNTILRPIASVKIAALKTAGNKAICILRSIESAN